jgi:MinD superfamily P-loop ATPase
VNVCILSGKGGTGKTTVSVNLAVMLKTDYIDCDVEEPNGFLFLKPGQVIKEDVPVDYPLFNKERCTLCGNCANICEYHALANTKKSILLFPELCHGCHACELVCGPKAISYGQRMVGVIERGEANGIHCERGVLNVGEHMAVPVIRRLLAEMKPAKHRILDCSPGTSCNVTTTLKHADAAVVITEPTVFGLHDMELAIELLQKRRIPFGVVVNKSDGADQLIERYCRAHSISLFGRIPFSRDAAQVYSQGKLIAELPEMQRAFEQIARNMKEAFAWN